MFTVLYAFTSTTYTYCSKYITSWAWLHVPAHQRGANITPPYRLYTALAKLETGISATEQ